MEFEKSVKKYFSQYNKLNEQKDAWYTIASQKFIEGDKYAQSRAYQEVDAIQAKIDALGNPLEGDVDELIADLGFDS